jgi:DNA-binding NtrC family response regulator
MERQYFAAVLQETSGTVGEAARIAGVSRRTMTRKMQKYDLDPRQYRESTD